MTPLLVTVTGTNFINTDKLACRFAVQPFNTSMLTIALQVRIANFFLLFLVQVMCACAV